MFRFLIFLFFLLISPASAVDFPAYSGFVTDTANVLSQSDRQNLESRLTAIDQNGGHQIAILTIPSLGGITIEEYAQRVFESWQIGQKNIDNGLLILLAVNDRQIRIEVGYGLEPYITDARAGDIIRNQLAPEFKNGNYYAGFNQAIDVIQKYLTTDSVPAVPVKEFFSFNPLYFLIFIYLASFLGRSKSFWAGAVFGFIFGLLTKSIFLAFFYGIIGLILDFILSRNYRFLRSTHQSTGFWSSSGGFKSSGSGFGGFGGGHSGGGGASGHF